MSKYCVCVDVAKINQASAATCCLFDPLNKANMKDLIAARDALYNQRCE